MVDEMDAESGTLERALAPDRFSDEAKIDMDEKTFRWMMNEDAMATEKLAEGIRAFAADLGKLRAQIEDKLAAA